MQTQFTDADLQKPHIQEAERILRTAFTAVFVTPPAPLTSC